MKGTLYFVYYQIVGSRMNGSYLVCAEDKRHAHRILRAISYDYCRFQALSEKDVAKYPGEWQEMTDDVEVPAFGEATHVECGT